MKFIKELLEQKGDVQVQMVSPNDTVFEAVTRMVELNIGAVLVSGARAPVLVRREDLKLMKDDGPVVVDVAVHQTNGCGVPLESSGCKRVDLKKMHRFLS